MRGQNQRKTVKRKTKGDETLFKCNNNRLRMEIDYEWSRDWQQQGHDGPTNKVQTEQKQTQHLPYGVVFTVFSVFSRQNRRRTICNSAYSVPPLYTYRRTRCNTVCIHVSQVMIMTSFKIGIMPNYLLQKEFASIVQSTQKLNVGHQVFIICCDLR